MGNSTASNVVRLTANVRSGRSVTFRFSLMDLVDHIVLLRRIISRPEMTGKSDWLKSVIHDYCYQMSHNSLMSKRQQSKLPLEIEWIWHVHRLHPRHYLNDCLEKIPGNYLIDKKIHKYSIQQYPLYAPIDRRQIQTASTLSFVPSIDLLEAVLRQKSFLEKFERHPFFSIDIARIDANLFQNYVENYVCFLKLARENQIIVPSFDIDLIWHTHLRHPLSYIEVTKSLCGFVLDHDDSISQEKLSESYRKTAELWTLTYNTNYGHHSISSDLSHANLSARNKTHQTTTDTSGCGGSNDFYIRVADTRDFSGTSEGSGDGGGGDGDGGGCGGCGGD